MLTFRLFLQPRDGIELHQMADLYHALPLPDEGKYWVRENIKELDSFLDSPGTQMTIALDGVEITHRMMLETFLYGDLAHINEDKRRTYETWKAGPAGLFLESMFEYVVGEVLKTIFWLRRLNLETITVLQRLP